MYLSLGYPVLLVSVIRDPTPRTMPLPLHRARTDQNAKLSRILHSFVLYDLETASISIPRIRCVSEDRN